MPKKLPFTKDAYYRMLDARLAPAAPFADPRTVLQKLLKTGAAPQRG